VILVAVAGVLLLVWGASALVKAELLRRQVNEQVAAVEPQVREVKALQNEIAELRKQVDILAAQDDRVTVMLKELSDLIPADAYLSTFNLRNDKVTIDGFARSASDLITALEKSKHFKNVSFTSPTTRTGDKERFSLVAEVEK
jgi:general secretion pathway protein L